MRPRHFPWRWFFLGALASGVLGFAAYALVRQLVEPRRYEAFADPARAVAVMDSYVAGGAASVDELLLAVRDQRPIVRKKAAVTLGQIGARRNLVLPVLVELTNDVDWNVRCGALYSIGLFGHSATAESASRVEEVLQDSAQELQTRRVALDAASKILSTQQLTNLVDRTLDDPRMCASALSLIASNAIIRSGRITEKVHALLASGEEPVRSLARAASRAIDPLESDR